MNATRQHRRVATTVAALALTGAIATVTTPAAPAAPVRPPSVTPAMMVLTPKWVVGCRYLVSALVTDRRAPVSLTIRTPRGRLVQRLRVRDEIRTDDKRVATGYWVPRAPGQVRLSVEQNGVRMMSKQLYPVVFGWVNGSGCYGI
ncbi:hypothetical protein [Gordonia sp. (in: high G+C Gram-positive bacteria)]|uniref:hypothetical protein n=1 Tax=Gordonia sp. (in: high G+C Gram-positive bacteria) TaxID=84139 RepID=UPI0039E2EB1E